MHRLLQWLVVESMAEAIRRLLWKNSSRKAKVPTPRVRPKSRLIEGKFDRT